MPRWVPLLVSIVFLAGCAATARGLVQPAVDGPTLVEPLGAVWTLELETERARLLRHLDGEEVEIEGARRGRKLKVRSWKLLGGTHGLQVFLGVLRDSPAGLVVMDEVSGGAVLLDEDVADELYGQRGQVVLLEGYVEGAQAVRVVYYRVLADLEAPE